MAGPKVGYMYIYSENVLEVTFLNSLQNRKPQMSSSKKHIQYNFFARPFLLYNT